MAMPNIEQFNALVTFLTRAIKDNTKSLDDLKVLSLDAFARMSDGTTTITVNFEGGGSTAQINCDPHVLLNACEQVLAANDAANTLSGASMEDRYIDFSGNRIST